jgi:hypothetical protein
VVLLSVGLTAALLLVLVGVNLLVLTRHVKFDLTKNRFYSLTPESKDILKNIKQDIKITLVVTTNPLQPPSYNLDDVKRLMGEYEYNSRHIKWEMVDVFRNPKKAQELNVTFGGKALVQCAQQKEEVTLTRDNEEGLTTAIYRVTKPNKDVVYYLTGHGELKLDEFGSGEGAASELRKALGNLQLDVKELVLAKGGTATPGLPQVQVQGAPGQAKQAAQDVPPDCKALLILGPETPLSRTETDAIGRYVDQAGSGTVIALGNKPGAPTFPEILSKYKVEVRPGIVIDPYKSVQDVIVPYVERPTGHEVLNRVGLVWLPWSRGFKIEQSTPPQNPYGPQQPPDQPAKPLLQSSDAAWLETTELKQGAKISPAGKERGPLTMGVVIDTKKEKPPTPPGMPEQPEPESGPGSRLVVLGSALMFADDALRLVPVQSGGNLTLASQVVTWLTGGTPVSVPAKKPYSFQVSLKPAAQIIVPILVILVIPLGTLFIGAAIWWKRR